MSTEADDRDGGGRAAIRVGAVVVLVAFGGFGAWAALARLESAAIAHGEVKVESYRKTVQHREGGIVRRILVAEGDRVAAGQPVVLLDDTSLRARWRQLHDQYLDALADKARLLAERDQAPAIDFSILAAEGAGSHVAEVERAQTALLAARRALLAGQAAVIGKRLGQLDREAEAVVAEQVAKDRQIDLIRDEAGVVAELVRKGLGLRPRLLALQRDEARLVGERNDSVAQVARIRQQQAAAELEIANIRTKRLDQVADDLRHEDTILRDLQQQLVAARDVLSRTVVRAPQDGVVVGLRVHTPGGVLAPGEAIMDVVPGDDQLVVEAQVKPEDVDRVHPGRPAQVRLHTFMAGLTPPALGRVVRVSPDLIRDDHANTSYYLARVVLDPASLRRLPGPLSPGMQADVLIATGARTPLEYLVEPLSRSMAVAFRER